MPSNLEVPISTCVTPNEILTDGCTYKKALDAEGTGERVRW
jgi:hypothetical protein